MNKKIIFIFALGIFLIFVPRADAVTELRTVEYFINNQSAQLAANAWWNSTFYTQIQDTDFSVVDAYIDIYASYETAGTTHATWNIYLNNTLIYAAVPDTSGEVQLVHIVANATSAFYTGLGSTQKGWQLALKNGAANTPGGFSAKLVVTYQYTGPPKTKTLRYYIDDNPSSMAKNAWNNETFSLKLNGTNPVVKSAFFEFTEMHPTAADSTPLIYLNNTQVGNPFLGGLAPSYGFFGMFNASSTSPAQGIYGITDTTERNYQFALKCGAGDTCEGIGATLVVTYESDAEAPIETTNFYINSTAAQIAANGWFNTTFFIELSDDSPIVKSAYIITRGALPTAATATSISVYLNNTLLGTTAYSAGVELANFMIFSNASASNGGFYGINDNNARAYQVSIKCVSGACDALSAELVLTYEYAVPAADSTPPQSFETGTNATAVAPGAGVLIYTNWTDETALSWATLQTNETGAAKNYTASYAPISLSGKSSWSNFTWSNASVAGGTEIAWKIFANDSTNNTNGTAEATFRIFQQINQPIEQSLTINFQNQNIQNLFAVLRNAIAATLQIDKASTFMRSANEAVTTNTAFTSLSTFLRAISQAVTTNAAYATVSNFLRTISQIVAASFATQSIGAFFKTITNAITTNTVVGPVSSLFKIISQAFATNSLITSAKGSLVFVSQAITQNAATQTVYSLMRTISQALTPNSITNTIGFYLRPISQAIVQNSAVQSISSIFKTISQAVTQNAVTQTLTSFFRTISQAFTQTTATQALSSIFKNISQAITQNSATQTIQSIFKSISQAVTQNAATQALFSIFRTISQTITANTLAQSTSSIFRIISQAVTQNAATQAVQSIFRIISQAVTQNAATQAVQSIFRIISQAVTQNSATQTIFSFFRTISQAVTQNSATQTIFSFFRSLQQSVSANIITQPLNSFFRSISNSITQSSVAKSVSSLFRNISEFLTANTANKIASNFLRSVSQYFQPQAFGFGGAYHRFFISVSQTITHNFNLFTSAMRAPPHPTGPEVVVVSFGGGGGPGLGQTRIQPTIPLRQATPAAIQFLKQPVIREVTAGEPIVEGIIVKNIGGRAVEELEAEVSGIEQKWITILPSTIDLEPEEKYGFTLFITAPKDAEEGDYTILFKLTAEGIEEKTAFMLRVKKFMPALDKAVTKRAVAVDVENKKTDIVVNVQNGPETRYNVLVTENIKKEIANSTDFIEFKDKPDEIIEKDPIVRWKIKELAPFETKNFTYTVKQVLPEFTAYVYWATEEVALSPGILQGLRVAPFKPIELTGGRITPAPVVVENIGNKSRNVSVGMGLPESWSLIPLQINYIIIPNETKLFAFNILLPTDVYPGYYIGKVRITADGETMIKEYEFAVLNNLELLVRPLVIVVSIFFILGVVWIRIKIIELNTEISEIKRLTEVHRTKEEIEERMEKTRRGLRDLEALRRDNVIDNYTYNIEKEELEKTFSALNKNLAEEKRFAKEESPERSKNIRKVYSRAGRLQEETEKLEADYSKGNIEKSHYKIRKAMLDSEMKEIKKIAVGNRPVLEKIKELMKSKKALALGMSKLKLAYEEGFITKGIYESSARELKERNKSVDKLLRKKVGAIEKTKKEMIGSNVFLKVFSQISGKV